MGGNARQELVESVSFALPDVHSLGFDVVPTVRGRPLCKVPKHLDTESTVEIIHNSLLPRTTNNLSRQASRCARLRHNVIGELKGSFDYLLSGDDLVNEAVFQRLLCVNRLTREECIGATLYSEQF